MAQTNELTDPEFGVIAIRRSAMSHSIRVRVAPDGRLRASMPPLAPLFLLKRMLNSSRDEIRDMITQSSPSVTYRNGDMIGKSHTLVLRPSASLTTPKAHRSGTQLIIELPNDTSTDDPSLQRLIRDEVIKILRREAKAYLPRRLKFLAEKYGFSYQTVRFSHASSRWGSCSSNGTISLNIALMKLPFEQIDYVLMHELAHTRQMNHSQAFWALVETMQPQYRTLRAAIKKQTPTI